MVWKNNNFKEMWTSINKDLRSLVVIGGIRTGKTCLVYKILEHANKQVYVYEHPKPHLIKSLGFKSIEGLGSIERLQDCVLWIDEINLYFNLSGGRGYNELLKLLTLCGQRNITLIISTSNSRSIVKGLEAYVDAYCVKNIDFKTLKRGSMVKEVINKNVYLSPDGFELKTNEYIFDGKRFKKYNGIHKFKKPEYFSDGLSNPYRDEEVNEVVTSE